MCIYYFQFTFRKKIYSRQHYILKWLKQIKNVFCTNRATFVLNSEIYSSVLLYLKHSLILYKQNEILQYYLINIPVCGPVCKNRFKSLKIYYHFEIASIISTIILILDMSLHI